MFNRTSIKYLRQWAAKEGRKPFTLYNIPIYYAGHLHVFLERKIGGMAFG